MKNVFLKTNLILTGMMFFSLVFAQGYSCSDDPQANERVIGIVSYEGVIEPSAAYSILVEKAKKEYPNKIIDLRSLRCGGGPSAYYTHCTAKVIQLNSPETKLNETLIKALDKAMSNVRAGSRLAIDQISVSGELNRETVNDQLLDILLDRNYRVVAKEYLERLKAEQEEQQGGGFNERTTAKTDNFSGVGYFLNVRVTEKSIRIQVINVSTGEYEGNATVDF